LRIVVRAKKKDVWVNARRRGGGGRSDIKEVDAQVDMSSFQESKKGKRKKELEKKGQETIFWDQKTKAAHGGGRLKKGCERVEIH